MGPFYSTMAARRTLIAFCLALLVAVASCQVCEGINDSCEKKACEVACNDCEEPCMVLESYPVQYSCSSPARRVSVYDICPSRFGQASVPVEVPGNDGDSQPEDLSSGESEEDHHNSPHEHGGDHHGHSKPHGSHQEHEDDHHHGSHSHHGHSEHHDSHSEHCHHGSHHEHDSDDHHSHHKDHDDLWEDVAAGNTLMISFLAFSAILVVLF